MCNDGILAAYDVLKKHDLRDTYAFLGWNLKFKIISLVLLFNGSWPAYYSLAEIENGKWWL